MKILLIEDNRAMLSGIAEGLIAHRYQVDSASDGRSGLALAQQFAYDLVLLDYRLPDLIGADVCKKLRKANHSNPILLLTDPDKASDRVAGLNAGADDCLIKPFEVEELLAKVRALLRRSQPAHSTLITWENLLVDTTNYQVMVSGQPLRLTPKEYGVLELLLLHPKRVFSRSDMLDRLWDSSEAPGEETVSTHIKCLRQKLKAASVSDPIETVHGLGYRLKSPNLKTPALKTSALKTFDQPPALSPSEVEYRRRVTTRTRRVWLQSKQRFMGQIEVLSQAAEALASNQMTEQLRQQAKREAHKLAGVLGIFDLTAGSQLCRQIEDLLQPSLSLDASQALLLSTWVEQLWQEFQRKEASLAEEMNTNGADQGADAKKIPASSPECSVNGNLVNASPVNANQAVEPNQPQLPLLLVIDADQGLTDSLRQDAAHWSLRVEVASQIEQAFSLIAHQSPQAILLDVNTAAEQSTLVQAMVQHHPSIPLLAWMTKPSGLEDRLAVARLGACSFLEKPLPNAEILSLVVEVIRRNGVGGSKQVLIVDDDVVVLNQLSNLLQPLGVKVTGLNSPHQFWQVLTTTHPHLLVLDLEMPDFNGIELAQAVRVDPQWRNLPILFLSTHTEAAIIDQAFMVGADDYVSKLEPTAELVNRIIRRLKRIGFEIDRPTDRVNEE